MQMILHIIVVDKTSPKVIINWISELEVWNTSNTSNILLQRILKSIINYMNKIYYSKF